MRKSICMLVLMGLLIFALVGCRTGNNKAENGGQTEENIEGTSITVAAASDLTLAFTEIGKLFEQETGNEVIFSFGSTGQLADQIEHGAPFDVFAAANISFVDRLRESGHVIADTQELYAEGRIVYVTHKDSPFSVDDLSTVLNDDVKVVSIANPDHAPYGLAAKEALQTAGYWEQIESKMVYGRNVSEALTFVETKNADVGIIALSILNKDKMKYNLLDADLHNPLLQSIAVVTSTKEEAVAREFILFINGPTGRPVMESYGFVLPE